MAKLHLTMSCGDYDRTHLLIDGTVQPEAIDLTVIPLASAERHARFTRDLEFDICELQMGNFLGWMDRGAPFTAIPVFPHRKFCHGNLVVHTQAGVERPADLAGKRIGLHLFCNPVVIWLQGMLLDEYGVDPRSLTVYTDGAEQVPGWEPPPGLNLQRMPRGRNADALLAAGEVDAYMLPDVGVSVRSGVAQVRRMWPDYRDQEIAYFRRTGIFPIRHTVVIKNEVLERHPWVAVSMLKAFTKAKDLGIAHMSDQRRSFLAWYGAELEAEREIFGPDPWPYSVEENRTALETMARYAAELGVTSRTLSVDEMFTPSTLVKPRFSE